jgi:hypothetical protein
MLRRLSLILLGGALLLLLGAAAGSGARLATSADQLVGEWTPDKSSNPALAGHSFTIAEVSQQAATASVGPDSLPSYDKYCDAPDVQDITYYTLSYTWDDHSHMGGCVSSLTEGHLYAWGLSLDVAYVHPGTSNGEDVLNGAWGRQPDPSSNPKYLTMKTARHPHAQFLTKVKYSKTVKRGTHIAEVGTVTGVGDAVVVEKPPTNCVSADVPTADGKIGVDLVKVGGPSVVELDKVTVSLQGAVGQYQLCDTQNILSLQAVSVTKSDPHEKDACKVGSRGTLNLVDRSAKYGGDLFKLDIPGCDIALDYSAGGAPKGSSVAVAIDFNEKGY